MLDELDKYTDNGHFFFEAKNELATVCNAPLDKSGVFVIYKLHNGKIELVYIGYANNIDLDLNVKINSGLKNEIVNGIHFDKNPRSIGLTYQLLKDKIDALDIYWYVTNNSNVADDPKVVQTQMLKRHIDVFGKLPKWNK
jgi:hypothetical protein